MVDLKQSPRQTVHDAISAYAKDKGLFEQWGAHIDVLSDKVIEALKARGYRPPEDRGPGNLG
jgi:hypothetical protein